VKLTIRLHLLARSRIRGDIPLLPLYAFKKWCSVKKKAQGQRYLYIYQCTHNRSEQKSDSL